MADQEKKMTRGSYFAVVRSKDAESNYAQILEAPTRKELAKIVASTTANDQVELLLAVRGRKLIAQEQKTVQFS